MVRLNHWYFITYSKIRDNYPDRITATFPCIHFHYQKYQMLWLNHLTVSFRYRSDADFILLVSYQTQSNHQPSSKPLNPSIKAIPISLQTSLTPYRLMMKNVPCITY
eukprot:337585_1